MREGKGSTLVHLLVVILSLVAFVFSFAAERRRSVGTVFKDEITNATYCIYNSDVATGYGADFLGCGSMSNSGCNSNTECSYQVSWKIYAQNFSCETLRKGVFIAAAVFVVATMATTTTSAHKANRTNSTVGMTGYP